jgi:hypothetical protein
MMRMPMWPSDRHAALKSGHSRDVVCSLVHGLSTQPLLEMLVCHVAHRTPLVPLCCGRCKGALLPPPRAARASAARGGLTWEYLSRLTRRRACCSPNVVISVPTLATPTLLATVPTAAPAPAPVGDVPIGASAPVATETGGAAPGVATTSGTTTGTTASGASAPTPSSGPPSAPLSAVLLAGGALALGAVLA